MKKGFIKIISCTLCVCTLVAAMCFAGCSTKPGDKFNHIVDPNPIGGEKLLDDGGKIKSQDSVFAFKGVEFAEEDEHIISFDTDADKIEADGIKQAEWKNSGQVFKRYTITANSAKATATFKLDFSSAENTIDAGMAVNLIASRGSVLLSVSTDKEKWINIGYNTEEGIRCDAKVHLEELGGKKINDRNLYRMYYLLGEYLGESKVLYVRAGFSRDYYQGPSAPDNNVGADLIGYICYYDKMKIVGKTV